MSPCSKIKRIPTPSKSIPEDTNTILELCDRLEVQDTQVKYLTAAIDAINVSMIEQRQFCKYLNHHFDGVARAFGSWQCDMETAVRRVERNSNTRSGELTQDIQIHATMLSNVQTLIQIQQSTVDKILEANDHNQRSLMDIFERLPTPEHQVLDVGRDTATSHDETDEACLATPDSEICDIGEYLEFGIPYDNRECQDHDMTEVAVGLACSFNTHETNFDDLYDDACGNMWDPSHKATQHHGMRVQEMEIAIRPM